MVKHYCDHCDKPCDPLSMVAIKAIPRDSRNREIVDALAWSPLSDERFAEVCEACAKELVSWLTAAKRGTQAALQPAPEAGA